MVKILEVLEHEGNKYVPLADYQALLAKYEATQKHYSNAEIIAAAGEDEVYSE